MSDTIENPREFWVNEYDSGLYPGVDVYTSDHHRTREDANERAQLGRIAVLCFREVERISNRGV